MEALADDGITRPANPYAPSELLLLFVKTVKGVFNTLYTLVVPGYLPEYDPNSQAPDYALH